MSIDRTESVAVIIVGDDEGRKSGTRSAMSASSVGGNWNRSVTSELASRRTSGKDPYCTPLNSAAQLDPQPRRGGQRQR